MKREDNRIFLARARRRISGVRVITKVDEHVGPKLIENAFKQTEKPGDLWFLGSMWLARRAL